MQPNLLYRFLKLYCKIGLWFYFKEWKVIGKENINKQQPTIFIANHQNAFLDAILMTCSTSLNPYFLARANVFNKSWAATLLSLIRIKPVFRFRDGFSTIKNNERIFQDCVDLLAKGETILLFPEANHNEPYTTRIYQKGFARIALLYTNQTGKRDINIQPSSIYFTAHHQFQTSVYLQIKKSFSLTEIPKNASEEKMFYDEITRKASESVKENLPILVEDSQYNHKLSTLLHSRSKMLSVEENLSRDIQFSKHNTEYKIIKPGKTRNALHQSIDVIWKVFHFFPVLLISWIVKNKIKDNQFIGSIKFAIGIFLVPIWYVLLSVIVYFFSGKILMPLLVFLFGFLITSLRKFTR